MDHPFVTPYSLLLASAFQLALLDAAVRLRRAGLSLGSLPALELWALTGGIVGAKALWIAEQALRDQSPFPVGDLRSGYSSMGGIGTAALFCALYLWKRCPIPLRHIDALTPSVSVGMAIAKIGCFVNGCCFGRPAMSGFSVEYGPGTPAFALVGSHPVLPLQILISLAACATYLLTARLYNHCWFAGCLFGVFLLGLGILRLVAYSLWGIPPDSLFLTTPMGTSSIAVVIGIVWIGCVKWCASATGSIARAV